MKGWGLEDTGTEYVAKEHSQAPRSPFPFSASSQNPCHCHTMALACRTAYSTSQCYSIGFHVGWVACLATRSIRHRIQIFMLGRVYIRYAQNGYLGSSPLGGCTRVFFVSPNVLQLFVVLQSRTSILLSSCNSKIAFDKYRRE